MMPVGGQVHNFVEIRSPQGHDQAKGMCEQIALMLQKNAIVEVSPDTPGFYSSVFLVCKASGGLQWQWLNLSFFTNRIPLRPFQLDITIFTDAFTQAPIWGILSLALHHWAPVFQGHQVMIATDNTTVVS